jgi:hypothetical protein
VASITARQAGLIERKVAAISVTHLGLCEGVNQHLERTYRAKPSTGAELPLFDSI